ncbi:hypothetical protein QQP08_011928 [Theobroma cacao]|nr:hypothetical protein QQP08_011928 [Theobroma cacao]
MEVPDNILNFTLLLDGPNSPVQAARMFTPGATISGFRISNVRKFGPLDENAATTGDGLIPNLVPRNARVAVAFRLQVLEGGDNLQQAPLHLQLCLSKSFLFHPHLSLPDPFALEDLFHGHISRFFQKQYADLKFPLDIMNLDQGCLNYYPYKQ